MKHTLIFLLALGSLDVGSNAFAQDRHDNKGYYDAQHKDYHQWNAEEDRRYHEYLKEHHRKDHDWKQASKKEQQDYWNWSHEHQGH